MWVEWGQVDLSMQMTLLFVDRLLCLITIQMTYSLQRNAMRYVIMNQCHATHPTFTAHVVLFS